MGSEALPAGGTDPVPAILLELAGREMRAGERILVALTGERNQALVGLDRRLLVLKAGVHAGLLLGARATSFDYRDVVGVEVERGPVLSVVWISSTAFSTGEKEWWQARDPSRDPFRAKNAVPVSTSRLELYELCLGELRQAIAEARDEVEPAESLATSLERLVALRDAGRLSEDEFQKAKTKLLG